MANSFLHCIIAGVPFRVLKASVTERINHSYSGEWLISSEHTLNPENLMGERLSCSMEMNGVTQYGYFFVTGVVSFGGNQHLYRIKGESPLWALKHERRSRYFSKLNIVQLFQKIIPMADFQYTHFIINKAKEELSYVEQHQCSDMAFFNRLIHEHELIFYFKSDRRGVSIYLDDQKTVYGAGRIPSYPFVDDHTDVESFKISTFCATSASQYVGAVIYQAECNIPSLVPGAYFELSQHPNLDENRQYRVISSHHVWDETASEGLQEGVHYRNTIQVAPMNLVIRPQYHQIGHAIHYPTLATVEGVGTQPYLSPKGEYYVHPMDVLSSPLPITDKTPVPQVQPFAGNQCGLHFPLLDKTQVVIGRINSHPDKPVILGALYNEQHQNPVTSKNPYQNILKTSTGHQLLMDDTPLARHITLETPDAENQMILNATSSGPGIHLLSKTGHFGMDVAGDAQFSTSQDAEISAEKNMSIKAESIHFETEKKLFSFQIGKNLNLLSQEDLKLEALKGVGIQINGLLSHRIKGNYGVSSKGSLNIISQHGTLGIAAPHRKIMVMAQDGPVLCAAGKSAIEWHSQGNITLQADKIIIQAEDISIQLA